MNYNERNRPPRNIIRTFRTDIDTMNKAQLNADAMGVPVSTYIHSLIANHQP
jgi:antitoxin component of RelBE/YafQ-DinJ toxin-antitoxin module